jgi:indole-3-glycerol phosphate synthase
MDLMILSAELTMTVLLEVHSADTLLAVRSLIGFPKIGNSVIGINNRDLSTMTVDMNTSTRLAELIDGKGCFVAESGIKTRADVQKLIAIGASAVLIGQTLCEHADIQAKFNELFG